jgi:hypothetical protein
MSYLVSRFGVALVGIQSENDVIKINPGSSYIMKPSDICFYMSITKEENSSLLIAASVQQNIPEEDLGLTSNLTRRFSFRRSIAGPKYPINSLKSNCEIPLIKSSTSISELFFYSFW